MSKSEESSSKRNMKPFYFAGAGVLVLALLLIGGYFFWQSGVDALQPGNQPGNAEQIQKITVKVGKLIALPEGETPQVATVSDLSKLQDQPFFAHAQNGDQLLIYNNAKKAILYRPSTNKIIEVGPVNLSVPTPEAGASSSAALSAKVRAVILNGTTTVGLTKTAETQVIEDVPTVEVVARENAVKQDYTKTVVVDVSGKNKDAAQKIAVSVNGQVGSLPSGESKPDADILIILGEDFAK